jgi:hypothetical protein
VQLQVLKLIKQIDEFDRVVRQKLMKFDEKLNKFERTVEYFSSAKEAPDSDMTEKDDEQGKERDL